MDEAPSGPAAGPARQAGAFEPAAVPVPSLSAGPPLPGTGKRRTAPPGRAPVPAPGRHLPGGPAGKWQPGVFWYWLGVLMLLAGIAWPLMGIRVTNARIAAFQRVPLPAGGRVRLPHAGTYMVSYEAAYASERDIPSFRVTARPVSPELRVRLLRNPSSTVYAADRRQGVVVLDLRASRPGTVLLRARRAPAIPGGSDLAVGSRLPGFVPAVVPGIGLMLGGIAGIVLVATLRSRNALMRVRSPAALTL